MNGIARAIDELGLLIESKQKEIDSLRNKIKLIEQYLDVYEECLKRGADDGYGNTSRSIDEK